VAVRTPSGATIGEAGDFRVHVEAEATRTEALGAAVAVQAGAEELTIGPRQGARVEGGVTGAVVDLLLGGRLVSPEPLAPLGRPEFRWEPVEGSFAYRLEIARNEAFTAIVWAETVTGPEHAPPLLLLPRTATETLWWRVSPVDRFGFVGVPTEARAFRPPAG
jgi:hypothetical protein